eukprot:4653000-Alexandrium_andersonii.AAC.1
MTSRTLGTNGTTLRLLLLVTELPCLTGDGKAHRHRLRRPGALARRRFPEGSRRCNAKGDV